MKNLNLQTIACSLTLFAVSATAVSALDSSAFQCCRDNKTNEVELYHPNCKRWPGVVAVGTPTQPEKGTLTCHPYKAYPTFK